MGKLQLRIVEASNVPNVALFGSMDIYCKVRLDKEQWFQTGSVQMSVNPKWTANNVFEFHVGDENSSMLHFELWNKGTVSDDFLGSYSVGLNGLFRGVVKDERYLLQKCTAITKLRLRLLAVDFGLAPPAEALSPGRVRLTPPPSPTPEPVAVVVQPAQPGAPQPPPSQPQTPPAAKEPPVEIQPSHPAGPAQGGDGSTSTATTKTGGGGTNPYSSRPAAEQHRTEPKPYQTTGPGNGAASGPSSLPEDLPATTTAPRHPEDHQNPPRPQTEPGIAPPVASLPPPPEMPLPPPMEHTTQLPIFGSAHDGCPVGECIYVIQPKLGESSGRILGVVGGGRVNGAPIVVSNPHSAPGSDKPAGAHQQWLCQDRGIGYVSFVPLHGTNLRLDSNETAPGSRIGTTGLPCVWESTDPRLASQFWRMEPMERGYFKIHRLKPEFPGAADADLVLEVEGDFAGAGVKLSPAVFGAPTQLFRFYLIRTR